MEFWQPNITKLVGTPAPLGYLDLDQVDDLLRALEMILTESNNASKKEQFVISYTAPGGIDVFYTDGKTNSSRMVIFRKKWYSIDDYGVPTTNYSQSMILLGIKELPKVISSIKEAQVVGKQIFEK